MKVDVENLLKSGFAVRQKKVYALAPDATLAKRSRKTLRYLKHMAARRLVQVGED
jgi:hypothetical protein